MKEKLVAVFLPLILLALAFAAGFSLLVWLDFETGWLPLDDDVVAIWLPVAFAIAITGFAIAPRLHLLKLNEARNIPFLYHAVAVLCIAGPTILAVKYVQAVTGEVAQVANGPAIAGQHARFYTVDKLCLNRAGGKSRTAATTSGDHDEDLDVDLYFAIPVCAPAGALAQVWLGYKYDTRIDNRLSDKEKDDRYRVFFKQSVDAINAERPERYRYLEKLGTSSDRRAYLKAMKDGHIAVTAPIVVVPHTDALEVRGPSWAGGAIIAFLAAAALWFFMVSVAPLVAVDDRGPAKPGYVNALLIPHRESFGLPILLDINLLVFAAMVLAGLGFLNFELDDLVGWGASSARLDHGIGFVRLITATFVHGGIVHILGNMYGLLVAAMFLTPVARNTRLIACYLVCGLGGSLLSKAVDPQVVTVGASGAIFGLFGVLIALILLRDAKMLAARRLVLINVGIYLVLNAFYGATTPGIDNFAHIGGFLTGLVCGLVLYILDRREKGYGVPSETAVT